MAFAGIGVDMIEIARVQEALDRRPTLVSRVYTDEERAYCETTARPAAHYAARFAARGAVVKALDVAGGRGIGMLRDVWVRRGDDGRPRAVLTGGAAKLAEERGVREIALSLSLTHDVAVANAVAVTDEVRPHVEERRDPKAELRETFRRARTVLDELEQIQNGVAPTDAIGQEEQQQGAEVPTKE